MVTDELIITKWSVIKPRLDFSYGSSVYYLKKGIKISKIFDDDMNFLYYYCDIIKTEYVSETNEYIFHDLLIDVIIEKDGFVKVIDLQEIPEALDQNLISLTDAKTALTTVNYLLTEIYQNRFNDLSLCLSNEIGEMHE